MPHSNPWLSASSSVAFGSHAYDGVGEMDAQKLNLAPVTFRKAYICLGFVFGTYFRRRQCTKVDHPSCKPLAWNELMSLLAARLCYQNACPVRGQRIVVSSATRFSDSRPFLKSWQGDKKKNQNTTASTVNISS